MDSHESKKIPIDASPSFVSLQRNYTDEPVGFYLVCCACKYEHCLWDGILGNTKAARQHNVSRHSTWMIVACSLVGLWLVGYVVKQVLFGRDQFGGTSKEYWRYHVSALVLHTSLAIAIMVLGTINLYASFFRLRHGTAVGAMVLEASKHRVLEQLMIRTFSGTLQTAYVVSFILFR